MCEFLTGSDDKDRKRIAQLTEYSSVERHVADALFHTMCEQRNSSLTDKEKDVSYRKAVDMYSKLIQARSDKNFSEIIPIAHALMGEE